ncbi:MAG: glycosyltransferase [Flavobacteriaceae bacterium]|nr:glycosyltransferase [Flavobacteriaceae bacterium]
MLSILIPTYNYSVLNLVKRVHKQVLETNILFEIIVIDDFSTAKSSILKNQEIKNMKYCFYSENKENIGRTATRNLLANTARYNWLLFLDADVLPKYEDFIDRFVERIVENYNLIVGGIIYQDKKPEDDFILRWKYGKNRESLTVQDREEKKYQSIISGCLFIQKSLFIEINNKMLHNNYGMDILFQKFLKDVNCSVLHIDNPVYHLGLESNTIFINKALEAVKTTYLLEKKGLLKNNLRPLQKSYLKLKKVRMISVFSFIISKMKKMMERNFQSNNPNLFWFDLYRLHYYIELKSKK